MDGRLDLSGFSPRLEATPATSEAMRFEESIRAVGGQLWTTARDPEDIANEIGELPALCAALREHASLPKQDHRSVALIDWTSLQHTRQLLGTHSGRPDPFTALADFAAVIAAVLFYDRVLVVPEADDANQLLGLDDVIRPLPTTLPGALTNRMHNLLEAHYGWALVELDRAATSDPQPTWLTDVARAWAALLPDVSFPSHAINDGYEELLGYNLSPDRRSYLAVTFREDPAAWVPSGQLPEAILDNDIRALFYERLSATLQHGLRDDGTPPEVRYIGGCMRSPMLLARTRAAEAALLPDASPENWLQESWRSLYQANRLEVQAPFWLQAVLAGSKDASDIPRVLGRLRHAGKAYRAHRAELIKAVTVGDFSELKKLMKALAGDVTSLTKTANDIATVGVEVLAAGLQVAPPVVSTELIKAGVRAAGAQSGWLRKLGLRLFQPRLWFVLELAGTADHATRVLQHAATLLHFGGKDAAMPAAFLSRLGQTAWIA